MALSRDPTRWRVGLVGYGEVGKILAEDLRGRGLALCAYDLKLDADPDTPTVPRARPCARTRSSHGVGLAPTHAGPGGTAPSSSSPR